MKLFVIVCSMIALASAADYVVKSPEEFQKFRTECVGELKVPADHVELFKKWEYPNDSITQCYLKCVLTKFGFFDDVAGFNVEYVQRQLVGAKGGSGSGDAGAVDPDNKLLGIIQGCVEANEKDSNACERAYRGATCFFKRNLKLVQQSVAQKEA